MCYFPFSTCIIIKVQAYKCDKINKKKIEHKDRIILLHLIKKLFACNVKFCIVKVEKIKCKILRTVPNRDCYFHTNLCFSTLIKKNQKIIKIVLTSH